MKTTINLNEIPVLTLSILLAATFFATGIIADAAMLQSVGDREPATENDSKSDDDSDDQDSDDELSSSTRKALKELGRMDPIESHAVPVLGVMPVDFADTWGDARSEGRSHEGTDIFAKRGTIVFSPFAGVVSRIATSPRGGLHVYVRGPGNESYYFAHLDSTNPKLDEGDVIKAGHFIGRVGDSGNAVGTSPHLHLGIYTRNGAINPYSRLTRFSNRDELLALVDSIIK